MAGPFTVDDFEHLSRLVLEAWGSAVDADWSVPAGTLEWSCFRTADHTVDCVFSYAFFLASRKQDWYPNWGEIHANEGASPADLLDGLRAACELLRATIVAAPADTTAIIALTPHPTTGDPGDFAARGGHELILHAHDVCTGLGVPFVPPKDLCARLLDHTQESASVGDAPADVTDPWNALLRCSGRPEA